MSSPEGVTYRVVVGKIGLDGHDRGAKIVARALRDAGFEVIYTGLHRTAEEVARAVVDEDADAVGISSLSGAHLTIFPKLLAALDAEGVDDVVVFGGGIVPEADRATLAAAGVARVFTPGAATQAIAEWLRATLDAREG